MNEITLRPYQAEAGERIHREWDEGRKRTLLVLPTGCGKTIVLSHVARDEAEKGKRVLIMAHREELLTPAADSWAVGVSVMFFCLLRPGYLPSVSCAAETTASVVMPNSRNSVL